MIHANWHLFHVYDFPNFVYTNAQAMLIISIEIVEEATLARSKEQKISITKFNVIKWEMWMLIWKSHVINRIN